jgi:serine/threonine protein kinase
MHRDDHSRGREPGGERAGEPAPLTPAYDKVPPRHVRIEGRRYEIIGELRLRGHLYLVRRVDCHPERIVYHAIDVEIGSSGGLCVIHQLPHGRRSDRRIRFIAAMGKENWSLPQVRQSSHERSGQFVVLSWIHGQSLDEWLRSRSGRYLRTAEALRLYRGLAHGLSALNEFYVHGDVHPGNLILREGARRELSLIDFGSAWLATQTNLHDGGDGAVHRFAAPEMHTSGHEGPDHRADQFSATVVFYLMLTGALPYDGYGGEALQHGDAVIRAYVPPSRRCHDREQIPRDVWDRIDTLCGRALALRAADRYETTRAWRNAADGAHTAMKGSSQLSPSNRALARLIDAVANVFEALNAWIRGRRTPR